MDSTQALNTEPGAPTRRLPCLVVVRGREAGRIVPLQRARMLLGRSDEACIRLEDRGVSRSHARLRLKGGKVIIEDMSSTNGSWINGRRVRRAELKDGDQLQFGACCLTFRLNHPDEGRLLRSLYLRATRDALTSLYNRSSLTDRLARELERHKRYRHGLAVLQLDLDHFKRINDSFGHASGDQALVAVARTLISCLRASDLAARVGGEEMVLVLPECGPVQARAIAEKVRAQIEGICLIQAGKKVPLTVSIGVASADDKNPDPAALLAAADAACYKAKRAGRNRVC
ncbi:MAG TPA: GGDEF domain-containing protein [Myxococcota bacterium]|nr:GGDEF domain-containing protein [Myxococcota bacterium]